MASSSRKPINTSVPAIDIEIATATATAKKSALHVPAPRRCLASHPTLRSHGVSSVSLRGGSHFKAVHGKQRQSRGLSR